MYIYFLLLAKDPILLDDDDGMYWVPKKNLYIYIYGTYPIHFTTWTSMLYEECFPVYFSITVKVLNIVLTRVQIESKLKSYTMCF